MPSCFIVDNADIHRNAIKRTWPEDKAPIYLCSFRVLKNWKNHIWTKVHSLGTLKYLVYKQLYFSCTFLLSTQRMKKFF